MEWLTVEFLNGLGTVGIATGVAVCLIFGKGLATQRELRQRDETIAWLRETNAELMVQNRDLVIGAKVATDAFDKISNAAAVGGDH